MNELGFHLTAPAAFSVSPTPDEQKLPTEEQINVCLSWLIHRISFIQLGWLMMSEEAFKLRPLDRINGREEDSGRLRVSDGVCGF